MYVQALWFSFCIRSFFSCVWDGTTKHLWVSVNIPSFDNTFDHFPKQELLYLPHPLSAETQSELNSIFNELDLVNSTLSIHSTNISSNSLSIQSNTASIAANAAAIALSSSTDNDTSSVNELQTVSLSGDSVLLSNGGGVFDISTATSVSANSADISSNSSAIQSNTDSIAANAAAIALSSATDNDTSSVNELQTISLSGDSVLLSNGGVFDISTATSVIINKTTGIINSSNITANTVAISANALDSAGIVALGFEAGPDTDTHLDSSGVAALGFVAGAHTVDTDTHIDSLGIVALGFEAGPDTDTHLDSSGVAALGFVAGAHTVDTDTHIDSLGIVALGFEAGPDTDTHLDSTGIAAFGFVAGAMVDTDTHLDSSGVAALGFVAGAHTVDTDTHIDSLGIVALGFEAGSAGANTDTQDLSQSGNTISLVDGGSVDVSTTTAVAANTTGVATNATNIATNVTAIALNTAKTGITSAQASAIVANTAKVTDDDQGVAEVYDATGWDADTESPTKNDVRDKFVSIDAAIAGSDTQDLSQSGNTISLVDGGSVDVSTTTAVAANTTGVATNATNIATNVTAIALNTAKTGITSAQASAIVANTAKVTDDDQGVAEVYDATGWDADTESPTKNDVRDKFVSIDAAIAGSDTQDLSQSGNTISLVDGGSVDVSTTTAVAANTTGVATNATNIATNVTAIALNTAKTGITSAQASAIVANTAKVTDDDQGVAEVYDATGWDADTESPTKNDVRDKFVSIDAAIAGSDTQDLSQSGNTISLVDGGSVDVSTTTAVAANTAKNTNVSTNLSITGTTGARTIVSSDGTDAVIPVATTLVSGVMSKTIFDEHVVNTAKTGITSAQASAIVANTAKVTDDDQGVAEVYDATGWDADTESPTKNDVRDKFVSIDAAIAGSDTQDLSQSGNTISLVDGGSVDVSTTTAVAANTTGVATNATNIATNVTAIALNTAKTGITSAQASAIVANTAKVTDDDQGVAEVYDATGWDADTESPTKNDVRDKFVSIDAAIAGANTDTQDLSQSGNTISLVDGGSVDVSTTTAVAANTTGVATNATNIATNVTAIALNTAKTGITSAQASAIVANTAKVTDDDQGVAEVYDATGWDADTESPTKNDVRDKFVSIDAAIAGSDTQDLSQSGNTISLVDGGSVDVSTTTAVAANTTGVATNATNIATNVTAIALNTAKTGITSAQASAIVANTAKVTDDDQGVAEVYDATGWDADTESPTKNDVRDKFVSIDAAIAGSDTQDLSQSGNTISLVDGGSVDVSTTTAVAANTTGVATNATNIATNVTAIALNTAKTGITSAQASAIVANTAKVTDDDQGVAEVYDATGWDADTESPTKNDVRDKFVSIDAAIADSDTQDLSQSGNTISLVDGGSVDVSTTTAVAANTTGVATNATNIATNVTAIALNTAKTGITSAQASAIVANTAKVTDDDQGVAEVYDATGWDADTESPTKNDVRDKFVSIDAAIAGASDNLGNHTATTTLNMGGNTLQFGNNLGEKINLYSNTYGFDIQAGELRAKSDNSMTWGLQTTGGAFTERMRLNNLGNFGIATNSPVSKLHVYGTTDASLTTHGLMVLGAITGLNLVLDENEIMARNNGATSSLHLNVEGGSVIAGISTRRVTLNSASDNINVSTSTGDATLLLNADADNNNESDNPVIKLSQDNSSTSGILGLVGNSGVDPEETAVTGTAANSMYMGTQQPLALHLATDNKLGLTIQSDQEVQIHTLNTGAGTDQVVTADANGVLRKRTLAAIGASDNLGNHTATTTLNMGGNTLQFGNVTGAKVNLYSTQYGFEVHSSELRNKSGSSITWGTQSGSTFTERMRLGSTGTLRVGNTTTGNVSLIPGDASNSGYLGIYNSSASRLGYIGYNNDRMYYRSEGNNHYFSTTATGASASTVIIQGGDNIRNGALRINSNNSYWGPALIINHGYTGSNGNDVEFRLGDVTRGSITVRTTGTTYNTTSDIRLKTDITPTKYTINDLMKVEVKDFHWKSDSIRKEKTNGFIAQNLNEIYPDAVTEGADNDVTKPWTVDYSRLTPLIVKSVQDLNEKTEVSLEQVWEIVDKQQQIIEDLQNNAKTQTLQIESLKANLSEALDVINVEILNKSKIQDSEIKKK